MHFDCKVEGRYSRLKQVLGAVDNGLARCFARPLPTSPARVLVLRPDRLGDMLVTLPLLRAVRARWPTARLEVVASLANADALELFPDLVDQVHVLDVGYSYDADVSLTSRTRNLFTRWREVGILARIVRGVDLLIDPMARRRHLLAAIRGRARYISSFDFKGGSFLLARRVKLGATRPYAAQMLDLIDASPTSSDAATTTVRGAPIAIHTGDGGLLSRRWNGWAGLLRALIDGGVPEVVLLGGPADVSRNQELVATLADPRVRCVPTETLQDLAATLRASAQLICVESGVMHLAAALGVPLVVMYAATDPALWAPQGSEHCVLRALEGGRCFRAMDCPSGACINAISIEQVVQASRILKGRR